MNLVLASQSPRRKELLAILGYPFTVVPSSIEETPSCGEDPETFVVRVAQEKGMEVESRVSQSAILSPTPLSPLTTKYWESPLTRQTPAECSENYPVVIIWS